MQFIKYCKAYKIVALCLPSYLTHRLQPLNISVFGPLVKAYKRYLYNSVLYRALSITKLEFL